MKRNEEFQQINFSKKKKNFLEKKENNSYNYQFIGSPLSIKDEKTWKWLLYNFILDFKEFKFHSEV